MGIEAVVIAVIQPQHPLTICTRQHLNLQDMHSESMILSSILHDEGPWECKAITHEVQRSLSCRSAVINPSPAEQLHFSQQTPDRLCVLAIP